MTIISSFAKSGMWDFKNIVASVAVSIPLAIQGVRLVHNIATKPDYLKEKFVELKRGVIDSFSPRAGEPTKIAVMRIAKNAFILLACLALMGAAAYASIYLLPATMGIATAISAIFMIGKLFLNAGTYKKQLIQAFTPKPGEDPAASKKRICKSILKTVALVTVLGAAIALGVYILIPLLQKFTWSIPLPFQTKVVVLFEYLALAILHGGLAIAKFLKGDKAGAAFHTAAAVAAVAFPIFYWNNEMRLHHSFYGLALMALPSQTAKALGTMVVLDSMNYMIEPIRGGVNPSGQFVQYDFINVIVDNFGLFFNSYAGAAIAENINNNWAQHKPMKDFSSGN